MFVVIRPARPADVPGIRDVVEPYARKRILLGKELVDYYESIGEFLVAESEGQIVGCGALHVLWEDIAEIRTLAVSPEHLRTGVGHHIVQMLVDRARRYGVKRVFCLTFEIDFFTRQGFDRIEGTPVTPEVYQELLRSHDVGVAEFLDLARAKPNTLGNHRMLLTL
ncbi:MAG: amino-acid N-acetyltransferase [Promicromonosporaceae bacterium]|nr:amino-acid N-acetyltransferase [Promicromonosporaceae bacterium]